MKKILITLFVFTYSFALTSFAHANEDVEKYVHEVVGKTINILDDSSINISEKKKKLRALMKENIDIDYISKKILLRHKNTISDEEFEEFKTTYEKYLISSFLQLVKRYKGQRFKIKSFEKVYEGSYIVRGKLVDSNNKSFDVDYLVRYHNNQWLVFDMITAGVSLLSTHKSEFNSILQNKGIKKLISDLQSKDKSKITSPVNIPQNKEKQQ